jgi:hypothetical protein
MALLWIDGFDAGDFASKYANIGQTTSNSANRLGVGRSINVSGAAGGPVKAIPAAAKVITGVGVNRGTSASRILFVAGDAGATVHLTVSYSSTGAIELRRGLLAGTVIQTSTDAVPNGAWNFIELSATINDTTGRAIVRLNGVVVIDYTGDTKNAGTNSTIDSVGIGGINYLFDDWYICDGTGARNNDFLGDVRVQTLYPSGAGSMTQLTPTGVANNWDNVNDSPLVTTTYNATSTGGWDLYASDDLPPSVVSVLGVQAVVSALKTNAGSVNVYGVLNPDNGSNYGNGKGAIHSLGTSVATYADLWENVPTSTVSGIAAGTRWTKALVNAIEVGVLVDAPTNGLN